MSFMVYDYQTKLTKEIKKKKIFPMNRVERIKWSLHYLYSINLCNRKTNKINDRNSR